MRVMEEVKLVDECDYGCGDVVVGYGPRLRMSDRSIDYCHNTLGLVR